MAPKNKFSKEQIIDVAFDIAKVEGMDGITIRKVAQNLRSSIAPIYVNFNDIDELREAVMIRIYDVSKEMLLDQDTGNPFRDIGIASLRFAKEYSVLFKELILKDNRYMTRYDEEMGDELIQQMKNDSDLEDFSDEELKTILLKMRIFQLGLSVMTANGLLPKTFTEEKIIEMLESTAMDVVYSMGQRKNK